MTAIETPVEIETGEAITAETAELYAAVLPFNIETEDNVLARLVLVRPWVSAAVAFPEGSSKYLKTTLVTELEIAAVLSIKNLS